MIDEESTFPTVADFFGLMHVLDRYHFTKQITLSWQNIEDDVEYRQAIKHILDSSTGTQFTSLTKTTRKKYKTLKIKDLLKKIHLHDK